MTTFETQKMLDETTIFTSSSSGKYPSHLKSCNSLNRLSIWYKSNFLCSGGFRRGWRRPLVRRKLYQVQLGRVAFIAGAVPRRDHSPDASLLIWVGLKRSGDCRSTWDASQCYQHFKASVHWVPQPHELLVIICEDETVEIGASQEEIAFCGEGIAGSHL